MDPDPDLVGPKTYGSDGSGYGSGSAALVYTQIYTLLLFTTADREGYTMHTAVGENGYSGVRVSPVPILLVTDQPGTAQLCSLVNLNQ
jgi:hypothetical protein